MPTGRQEQHITADVIYAGWRYVQATGDGVFREHELPAMAIETARFWTSRAELDPARDRYVLRGVIGPDEYHVGIDNNAFTNFMAAWNLALAADEVERLRVVHPHIRVLHGLAFRPKR